MKYIKTFENINTPQVGDYVLCEEHYGVHKNYETYNFIKNNIGRCYKIDDKNEEDDIYLYRIEYNFIPIGIISDFIKNGEHYYRRMSLEEIKFFSKNKEDVKLFMETKKYNL